MPLYHVHWQSPASLCMIFRVIQVHFHSWAPKWDEYVAVASGFALFTSFGTRRWITIGSDCIAPYCTESLAAMYTSPLPNISIGVQRPQMAKPFKVLFPATL